MGWNVLSRFMMDGLWKGKVPRKIGRKGKCDVIVQSRSSWVFLPFKVLRNASFQLGNYHTEDKAKTKRRRQTLFLFYFLLEKLNKHELSPFLGWKLPGSQNILYTV